MNDAMMERFRVEGMRVRRLRLKEEVAAVLREHWLADIGCSHETGTDTPMCACSRVALGTHASVGAAVEAWIAHVLEQFR